MLTFVCFVQVCWYLSGPNTDMWGRTAMDMASDFIKVNPANRFGPDICTLLMKAGGKAGCQRRRFEGLAKGGSSSQSSWER